MTPAFRSLLLVAALWSGALQAADLRVAVLVQDAAQVSLHGNLVPSSTPGADLVAFTDELAREICRRIRSRCAISYVTFAEILPGVEDGLFDLGFGNFLRAPKREKRVAFSEPIFRSASRLVGSPATARAFAGRFGQAVTLDNLRGARVAAMEGSQQQAFLDGLGDTVHIILPKQENALRRSVNQAIAEIRADGTGHRIMRRHFPVILD